MGKRKGKGRMEGSENTQEPNAFDSWTATALSSTRRSRGEGEEPAATADSHVHAHVGSVRWWRPGTRRDRRVRRARNNHHRRLLTNRHHSATGNFAHRLSAGESSKNSGPARRRRRRPVVDQSETTEQLPIRSTAFRMAISNTRSTEGSHFWSPSQLSQTSSDFQGLL